MGDPKKPDVTKAQRRNGDDHSRSQGKDPEAPGRYALYEYARNYYD